MKHRHSSSLFVQEKPPHKLEQLWFSYKHHYVFCYQGRQMVGKLKKKWNTHCYKKCALKTWLPLIELQEIVLRVIAIVSGYTKLSIYGCVCMDVWKNPFLLCLLSLFSCIFASLFPSFPYILALLY